MKEKLTAIFIILLFLLFGGFMYCQNSKNIVLAVKTPTEIVVDLNNNRIADDNETICLPNISSYTSNLNLYQDEIPTLTFEKGIAIGYLADSFANKQLAGKHVKVKFTGQNTPQCRFGEIYTDSERYSDALKQSGFGIYKGEFINKTNAKSNFQKAKKLKLVIFNHKSEKFHKLNCKYGRIAHDAVILEEKDLLKTSKPCKFCHTKPFKKKKLKKFGTKEISPVPNIISDGSIKIILTDFTKNLKPDRNCLNEVCKELVSLINSSQNSIDIALYGWSDIPKVKSAIISAQKRGVDLRLVYDTSSSKRDYYPETSNLVKIISNNRSDNLKNDKMQTNYLMHNKFIIFDDKIVLTGSMNFSLTGLSGFNQNNVVVLKSPEIARLYKKEFDEMYSGKYHNLKSKMPEKRYILSDGTVIKVYFSPKDKGITNGVIPLVNGAKKYIYVPAFLITHKPLTTALIKAKQRGVEVKIILDATSVGLRNTSTKELRAADIPVKIENYAGKMHSKTMIIDDRYIVTGSANFSNSGENKNDENQLIIENPKLAKFYKDFFLYLWAKIPDKYLKFNPHAESKYSIGSCSDGVDNDYDGKIDMADEGCK